MNRIRRLMGQMGLSPTNFQKDMAACVKSATMLGAEHWRNGDQTRGTIGQANDIQLPVSQVAWTASG